jgi:DNA-binding transcriptional regulator YbjK
MPPFNEARRDRLADAAIELLAREGARGLTHRAVDTEANEPAGTTSRYFRTREALMRGALERARTLHFGDLEEVRKAPAKARANATVDLAVIIHNALTTHRSRHLAMLELFLESIRRPELRAALTETRAAQNQLIREIHRAAGLPITARESAALVNSLTGLVFTALTTPDAVGGDPASTVDDLIKDILGTVRQPARPGRSAGDPSSTRDDLRGAGSAAEHPPLRHR